MDKCFVVLFLSLLCWPLQATEVHRWKLDETSGNIAVDSIGGVNGTLNNGAFFTGEAAEFDGVNDFVQLDSLIRFHDTENWTISLFYKGTDSSGTNPMGANLVGINTGDWWGEVTIEEGKAKFLHATANGHEPGWDNLVGTSIVTDDQWHHIVVRNFDNVTADVIVDGVVEVSGSSLMAGTPSQDVMSMRIFQFMHGPGQFTSGSLRDVRIFDEAISDPLVLSLNEDNLVPEPSSLIFLLGSLTLVVFFQRKK